MARAIRRSCRGGPDVVLLQEVESEAALLALRDGLGYRHAVFAPGVVEDVEEGQANGLITSVGLLSRLPVRRSRLHDPGRFSGIRLRPILEVELDVRGRPLTVLNSHWKSKVGGIEATEPARLRSAEVVARRLEEVLSSDSWAEVVVAGDLNLNLGELNAPGQPVAPVADPLRAGRTDAGVLLYDPWYELPEGERGSSVYGRRWQTADHFLLAPGLLDRQGLSYRRGGFRVVRLPFLVHPANGFPRRFDPSSAAAGGNPGFSDHLPLLLEIVLER